MPARPSRVWADLGNPVTAPEQKRGCCPLPPRAALACVPASPLGPLPGRGDPSGRFIAAPRGWQLLLRADRAAVPESGTKLLFLPPRRSVTFDLASRVLELKEWSSRPAPSLPSLLLSLPGRRE